MQRQYSLPMSPTPATALGIAGISVVTLAGWALDNDALKSGIPGLVAVNPLTATLFLLSAVLLALNWEQRFPRAVRQCLAAIVGISAFSCFVSYFTGQRGIDRMLFENVCGDNRMAPNTAVNFMLLAIAFFAIEVKTHYRYLIAQSFALIVLTGALISLVGYLYGAEFLYGVGPYIPMALLTAMLFGLSAVGFLMINPRVGVAGALLSPFAGGLMARRILPAGIIIPIVLGALRVAGQHAGYYDTEFGAAVMVVVTVVLLAGAILFTAATLNRADAERETAMQTIRLYADIVRQLPIGLTIWRLEEADRKDILRLIDANPAASELLGIQLEPSIGQTILEAFPSLDQATVSAYCDVAKGDQRHELPELQYGDHRVANNYWCVKAFPLPGRCMATAFENVTQRKLADDEIKKLNQQLAERVEQRTAQKQAAEDALRIKEEQLRQSQKMEAVGQLAGGVAHDFNNLLTIILGYSDVLGESPTLSAEQQHEMLGEIHCAAERAADLTRQLLAFSRKQVLDPKILNLNEVVAGMNKMLGRLIGEDIAIHTNFARELQLISADPGQIEQVIMNLAVNARDAMPQGGDISFTTENVDLDENYAQSHAEVTPGSYVMLAISDTGCGMDEATRRRIFEPFFTTKEVGKGTGLGLATVYGIVKQSGGHIWVYSEVGQGTVFKIYFPAVDVPGETNRRATVDDSVLRGNETILLVEDEQGVRALARRVLELFGYTVLEAKDPLEAIQLSRSHNGPIDLLLTDVIMPQMNGKKLSEVLVPERPEMKVLFMSGYTDDVVTRKRVLEPGVWFLQKPFTPSALATKLRAVLSPSSKECVK